MDATLTDDQDEQLKNSLNQEFAPRGTEGGQPEDKITDSHPGHTPETLSDYVKGQETSVGQYGPEQEKAVMHHVAQSMASPGQALAKGGAGLADAIMQGVARAGNPGFLQNLENREQNANKMALEAVPTLQKMNLENMGQKQKFQEMDPESPLSQGTQKAYEPLFSELGYPPEKINAMSAADIKSAMALMSEFGGKEMEAKIKGYELNLQNKRIESDIENQRTTREIESGRLRQETANQQKQRELEEKKMQEGALEKLKDMSWYSRVLHPGISGRLEQASGLGEGGGAKEHSQANEAIEWAKSHPTDPRAAEIIRRLGG